MALASDPGDRLDHNPAAWALNSPHGIFEEDPYAPERNELEAPGIQGVVAWSLAAASGADGLASNTRTDVDQQNIVSWFFDQLDVDVDEALELLDSIQYGFDQHPALPLLDGVLWETPILSEMSRMFQYGEEDSSSSSNYR